MSQNPASSNLTEAQLAALDQAQTEVEVQLGGLVALTVKQRRRMPKMGDTSEAVTDTGTALGSDGMATAAPPSTKKMAKPRPSNRINAATDIGRSRKYRQASNGHGSRWSPCRRILEADSAAERAAV